MTHSNRIVNRPMTTYCTEMRCCRFHLISQQAYLIVRLLDFKRQMTAPHLQNTLMADKIFTDNPTWIIFENNLEAAECEASSINAARKIDWINDNH